MSRKTIMLAAAAKCASSAATIAGTAGADRLWGRRRRDVVLAGTGNDRVPAGRGNALVCSGRGRNRLKGGPGRDRQIGGSGRNVCVRGRGARPRPLWIGTK